MKVMIEKNRDMFGRSNGTYLASFAGWAAEGKTSMEANCALEDLLNRANQWKFKRDYLRAHNATFCLYWADGWWYDIVRDDNAQNTHGSTGLSVKGYGEALMQMRAHFNQYQESHEQQH